MSFDGLKVDSGVSLSQLCEVQDISGASSSFFLDGSMKASEGETQTTGGLFPFVGFLHKGTCAKCVTVLSNVNFALSHDAMIVGAETDLCT